LRERVGVRGIKMEVIEILTPYHPHPPLPRRRGRGNVEFPDGDYLERAMLGYLNDYFLLPFTINGFVRITRVDRIYISSLI